MEETPTMAIEFVKTRVFPQGMAPADERQALELIEICGRTAYKSEDKITEDSARSFVLMLKKHGHLSVLEHSNAVLGIEENVFRSPASSTPPIETFRQSLVDRLEARNGYHRFAPIPSSTGFAMGGNYRSWIDTVGYLRDREPRYACFFQKHLNHFYPNLFEAPEASFEGPEYRVSLLREEEQMGILKQDPDSDLPVFVFKFICDRGITHEVVRHRVLSFTQESTRYVNYGNKGMTVILPEELEPFFDAEKGSFTAHNPLVEMWIQRAETIFKWYQEDLERGLKPQTARDILPNLLKSEIMVSGRWSGWRHFIALRDSKQAHPRIRFIAQEVRKYFETFGLF